MKHSIQETHLLTFVGLPAELDINLLIQQDPQKAAELLEIQKAKPQDIPSEMSTGWWRIIDAEQMQRVNKSAHPRYVQGYLLFYPDQYWESYLKEYSFFY